MEFPTPTSWVSRSANGKSTNTQDQVFWCSTCYLDYFSNFKYPCTLPFPFSPWVRGQYNATNTCEASGKTPFSPVRSVFEASPLPGGERIATKGRLRELHSQESPAVNYVLAGLLSLFECLDPRKYLQRAVYSEAALLLGGCHCHVIFHSKTLNWLPQQHSAVWFSQDHCSPQLPCHWLLSGLRERILTCINLEFMFALDDAVSWDKQFNYIATDNTSLRLASCAKHHLLQLHCPTVPTGHPFTSVHWKGILSIIVSLMYDHQLAGLISCVPLPSIHFVPELQLKGSNINFSNFW